MMPKFLTNCTRGVPSINVISVRLLILIFVISVTHVNVRQSIALEYSRVTVITENQTSPHGSYQSELASGTLSTENEGFGPIVGESYIDLNPMVVPKEEKRSRRNGLSEDCYAKRNEILRRHHNSPEGQDRVVKMLSEGASGIVNFQRLIPKHENSTLKLLGDLQGGLSSIDNEHIPQCTQNGKYVPTQCHKIGYCWCVNKYGQAIKNSASDAKEPPPCDTSTYESEGVDSLIVADVSARRIKMHMKPSNLARNPELVPNDDQSDTANNDGTSLSIQESESASSNHGEEEFNRRVSASPEPSLALVPNECTMSRNKAKERASRHIDDSIWIPDCDLGNPRLYAEKQCHKSRVCWCVDQSTGLPLRTSEQLAVHASINCTETRKMVDMAQTLVRHNKQRHPQSFYQSFSDACDASKRAAFVRYLINQFSQQISDYIKQNQSHTPPPGISSPNPHGLPDHQVSMWKFTLMDLDQNSKIDDREWTKFKTNFKLIDKFDDSLRSSRQHTNARSSMTPLVILRFQRRCWRDFLDFCGNGDILIRDSINLTRWLSCTELPSEARPLAFHGDKFRGLDLDHNADAVSAYTREAAIARSRSRNPFSSILKSD